MARIAPARPALLRTLNDRTVLDLLLANGPSSRADLARLSGLSKPTIAEVLSPARARAADRRGRRDGRPPRAERPAARPRPRSRPRSGPDRPAGPAHLRRPRHARQRSWPPRPAGAPTCPRGQRPQCHLLVTEAARSASLTVDSVREIVVGLPGLVRRRGRPGAIRRPDPRLDRARPRVRRCAGPSAHDVTVTVDNDVNLALIAERDSGAASTASVSALLWLADGIGLATDLAGTLYRGESGGAGEVGYIPVPAPTPAGRRRPSHADFQDLVGGAAVLRLARDHGLSGRTAAVAVERAVAGAADQPGAAEVLDELARRIALGLAVIVAVLDPGLVVLGGAVGRAGGAALALPYLCGPRRRQPAAVPGRREHRDRRPLARRCPDRRGLADPRPRARRRQPLGPRRPGRPEPHPVPAPVHCPSPVPPRRSTDMTTSHGRRRSLALVAVAAFLSFAASACTRSSGTAAKRRRAARPPSSAGRSRSGTSSPTARPTAIQTVVDDFEKANPGVKVDVKSGQDDEKMHPGDRRRASPSTSACRTRPTRSASSARPAPSRDLTPYITRDKVDLNQIPDVVRDYTEFEGKRCSMPMLADVYGLYYNKKLLAAAGYTEPPEDGRAS